MRTIPDPGFIDDDGGSAPAVQRALAAYDTAPEETYLQTLEVLQDSRVLVPVVALLGEVEIDASGLAREKTSDMAAVLLVGQDGRRGLFAFTSIDAMRSWNPEARPVPVDLRAAAQAAIQEGADALVLDVAGPSVFALEEEDLLAVARGLRLGHVEGDWAWLQCD